MGDIVRPTGGLSRALQDRGGLSKIRCLSARANPEVELEFRLVDENDPSISWKYILGLRQEARGARRHLISKEEVWKGEKRILSRPDREDKRDDWRLTQTHLEQINSNISFRDIYDFFNSVRYLHIIPELVRKPDAYPKNKKCAILTPTVSIN